MITFKSIPDMQSFNQIQETTLRISTLIFNMSEVEIFSNKITFDLRLASLESCLDLLKEYQKQI